MVHTNSSEFEPVARDSVTATILNGLGVWL